MPRAKVKLLFHAKVGRRVLRALCCGAVQFADVRNFVRTSECLKHVSNELGKELSGWGWEEEAPAYPEPRLALICVRADLGYFLLLPPMEQAHLEALGCFFSAQWSTTWMQERRAVPTGHVPFVDDAGSLTWRSHSGMGAHTPLLPVFIVSDLKLCLRHSLLREKYGKETHLLSIWKIYIIIFLLLRGGGGDHTWAGSGRIMACVWRSDEGFVESVISSLYRVLGIEIRPSTWLSIKGFYLPNHLTGPIISMFI